jgi:hypothetical protein
MGVTKLLKKLKTDNKYIKSANKYLQDTSFDKNITRIYIDFSFISTCVIDEYSQTNMENNNITDHLISKSIEKLKLILNNFNSDCEKHLFFESIASTAKLNEKINRKIYSVMKKEVDNDLMNMLDYHPKTSDNERLYNKSFSQDYINKLIDGISKSKISNIHFHKYEQSDPNENKGESEHRILNHIKNSHIEPNDIYYICTSDSDLILISMILTNNISIKISGFKVNIMIYENKNKILYFDSLMYIDYIYSLFKERNDKKNYKSINDFIFCMNILGNDFVPGIYNSSAFDLNRIISNIKRQSGNIIYQDLNKDKFKINKLNLLNFMINFEPVKNEYNIDCLKIVEIPDKQFFVDNYKKIIHQILLEQQLKYGNYIYYSYSNNNSSKFSVDTLDNTFKRLRKLYNVIFTDPFVFVLDTSLNSKSNVISDNVSVASSICTNSSSLSSSSSSHPKYKININYPRYNNENILKKDNQLFIEVLTKKESNFRVKNYLEGLDFILDMYFNPTISEPNYFWFYQHTKAPTLNQINNYLVKYPMPSHKQNLPSDTDYFTPNEYIQYIQCAVNKNIEEIKKIYGKITFDNIISTNHNNRIMFTHGINQLSHFYPKEKYFLDPVQWKKNKVPNYSVCTFNYTLQI